MRNNTSENFPLHGHVKPKNTYMAVRETQMINRLAHSNGIDVGAGCEHQNQVQKEFVFNPGMFNTPAKGTLVASHQRGTKTDN